MNQRNIGGDCIDIASLSVIGDLLDEMEDFVVGGVGQALQDAHVDSVDPVGDYGFPGGDEIFVDDW